MGRENPGRCREADDWRCDQQNRQEGWAPTSRANIVSPIPVVLDGTKREVTVSMEDIACTMGPDDSLTLQIIGSATPFENFTAFGVIDISDVDLTLPTANSAVVHFEKSLKSDKPPVTTGGLLGI